MRYKSLTIIAALVLASPASMNGCSDRPHYPPRTFLDQDTNGSGGSGGLGDGCVANAACRPGVTDCCSSNELLTCVKGLYAHVAWCNGEGETCDPVGMGCSCTPGARRCIKEAPHSLEECVLSDGAYHFQVKPCPEYEYCSTELDDCVACLDKCLSDEIRCSADKKSVEQCVRLDEPNCSAAVWVLRRSCADDNMYCVEPLVSPADSIYNCANECGGRGIALPASECSYDPHLSCSVLSCNPDTGLLEGDHVACLEAGAACSQDNQCASCVCGDSGVCIGNSTKPCPTKSPCP